MLYSLIGMLIMLTFLDKAARVGRLELADATLRYKLFSARDRLRLSLIKGETKYNKWFKYLDTTLTRTIHNVKDVNPLIATVAVIQFKKDPSFHAAYHEIESALGLPENLGFRRSYRIYIQSIGEYLSERHRYSLPVMSRVMIQLEKQNKEGDIHASLDPQKSGESVAPIFTISPQTSTVLKYSIGQDVYRQSGAEVHVSVR